MGSLGFGSKDISEWKSTGIYNYSSRSNMNALANSKNDLPNLKNDARMHVYLSGNYFQQNKVIIPNNNNAINIYCVYKLDPIASSRDTSFTIQNALFGAMQITKNATDNSNKLIGRIIEECTNVINETMINNKDNIANDNTITKIFIGLFSIVIFILIVCSCVFVYFKWVKGKKLFKNKYTDY